MAFIHLTNAWEGSVSQKLAINSSKVLSVYEMYEEDDEDKLNPITVVFAEQNSWRVKETLEEVVDKLNDNS
jgi:hypothetical protein